MKINSTPRKLALGFAVLGIVPFASATQVTSTWAGMSSAWQEAANWGGTVPNNNDTDTYVAAFPATNTAATTVDLGGTVSLDQLTLSHGAALTIGDSVDDAFVLTGGATGVGVSVPIYNTTTLSRTIAAHVQLAPATGSVIQFDTNASTSPTGDAPISLNLSGVVSGSAGLLKLGNGGLQLSGVNTYAGTTTVQRNWIYVGSDALNGVAGALGNATSAIELGNASTGTADTGLATNGAVTVGRDINANVTGTGTTFIGGGSKQTNASSAFTGTITLSRAVQLVSSTTAGYAVDFQGKFTGVGSVLKRAGGTVQFSNAANDYTGTTTVRGGYIVLTVNAPKGAAGGLGNATTAVALGDSNTTSNFGLLTNGAVSVGRDIALSATPAASIIASIGGSTAQTNASSTFGGTIALGRDTVFQSYTENNNSVTFSGAISSSTSGRGVITAGPGVIRLSGTNTYNGTTVVGTDGLGGTLLIDGANTGTGSYAVQANATLGGVGTLTTGAGASGLTVATGGTLDPGGIASAGTLGVTGDASITGTLRADLSGSSADRLSVVGTLTIDPSSSLSVRTLLSPTASAYVIADYATLSGTWSAANIVGLPAGWGIDYRYNGNNQIALTAVPEPTAFVAALLALPFLRRRSRQ